MNSRIVGRALAVLVGGLFLGVWAGSAPRSEGAEARTLRRLFADPPREYASAPLWVWNDLLTEDEIRGTMRDLAGQGVMQVFVHPRPGLMTPYLGADWFRLWKVALNEAGRLDMNVWIYDENSYPSGFAGGWVPEKMPEARGQGLDLREVATAPAWAEGMVSVHRLAGGAAEDLTASVKGGTAAAGDGPFLVGRVVRAGNSAWHGDRCYVNLLTPGVTEKFIEVTLGAYDREIGDQYGKRVPGVFTDEPNIRPAGGFPWCDDLAEQFQARRGYGLIAVLPALVREVGDWRRVRHDYFRTVSELFIERWGKPYYDACEERGLEFTGHYWDHEWPHCIGVPDNMAMAAWQHRPGVDTLMNQYAENTHAQFGNVRYCREVSSIANQLGRERTLVELYGAGGWDLRLEDMKRIADWLQVLGINTMDEHLSYVTLRGARKRDHPQSFSYHEPWWPAYHVHAHYMTRLSAMMSQGQQVNRVLVLEPTTTAWMYQGNEPKLKALGDGFFDFLMKLEAAQVEYDLGCEDVIARTGGITSGAGVPAGWSAAAALKVGQRNYPIVILPAQVESLTGRVRSLLKDLTLAGGQVFCVGALPPRTDGREDPEAYAEKTVQRRWRTVAEAEVVPSLREWTATGEVVIERAAGDRGILFHHRRELEEGQFLLLVNSSREHPSRGLVKARFGGIEKWDLFTGKTESQPHRVTASGVVADFELPPSGSLLLHFAKEAGRSRGRGSREDRQPVAAAVDAKSGPVARRVGPNVLPLDYVDVTVKGETTKDQYFYAANRRVWQAHGRERNPWDSAVQFKDELITKTFPADSGFEVAYRFTVEGPVPPDLAIVVERPDLYSVACNGVPLTCKVARRTRVDGTRAAGVAGAGGETVEFENWWLDRCFGRMPIAAAARPGENVITLKAAPFTMWHEIETAYVLGSFGLKPSDRGWVIGPDVTLRVPETDRLGWNGQGHPFHSAGVTYRQTFEVSDRGGRFTVALPDWYGSAAKVEVNGREAGWITAPPWECDVTGQVRRGENTIEVTVIGTLKNTLGPHHGNHALGSAWPGMFQNGPNPGPTPGARYATVAYGLFRPFVLKRQAVP